MQHIFSKCLFLSLFFYNVTWASSPGRAHKRPRSNPEASLLPKEYIPIPTKREILRTTSERDELMRLNSNHGLILKRLRAAEASLVGLEKKCRDLERSNYELITGHALLESKISEFKKTPAAALRSRKKQESSRVLQFKRGGLEQKPDKSVEKIFELEKALRASQVMAGTLQQELGISSARADRLERALGESQLKASELAIALDDSQAKFNELEWELKTAPSERLNF